MTFHPALVGKRAGFYVNPAQSGRNGSFPRGAFWCTDTDLTLYSALRSEGAGKGNVAENGGRNMHWISLGTQSKSLDSPKFFLVSNPTLKNWKSGELPNFDGNKTGDRPRTRFCRSQFQERGKGCEWLVLIHIRA